MTLFKTNRIRGRWYCFATVNGYDYSYEASTEYEAIELAKSSMARLGYIQDVLFPKAED